MIGHLIKKVFGTKNDRELKRLAPVVGQISALESGVSALDDQRLRSKTEEFRSRLASGTPLDAILPEVFAVVREVSRRRLGMRHFEAQLLGGIVLHEGKIAEMKTGEGKTLVATLPLVLNALTGLGAYLVTVNDYLAKRDAQWMGPIYHALGLSVGVIQHEAAFLFDPAYEAADRRLQHLRPIGRQEAYRADITYGTNNEFGFDYLRDNMTVDLSQCVQRDLHYAIVDEVDSILIDEARTPLIISGPTEESTDKYYRINQIIPALKAEEDYTVEEKTKTVTLTEEGNAKVERLLGVSNLYDLSNMDLVHHVIQGLKAHALFKRDVDYVVKDGEVLIVDEFTGRLMPGRRWSDGLHQAVEAKEGVKIANENQTLASITFQNYFRLYHKLAGMTGTADTEAAEFAKIYNLDVMVIPPNRTMIRKDYSDMVYRTEPEKFNAIVEESAELHRKGQPVLVGTISIEKSERLSALLKRQGIKHSVLNAKYHEKEAEIIAQAGRKNGVTIATNMAGRGTDILLGGNPDFLFKRQLLQQPDLPAEEQTRLFERIKKECEAEKAEVVALGGLHILGTERHESRRIDNQLRGRSGRQGDPGSSRFYLSLEDDLMRIFGSERISGLMQRLGMEEGIPIEHRMVTRAIENAQKKVEAHNFDIRKQLLEYDDVMNKQRTVIYEQRRRIHRGENLTDLFLGMIDDRLREMLDLYCPEEVYPEEWDMKGFHEALTRQFTIHPDPESEVLDLGREALRGHLVRKIDEGYKKKEAELGEPLMRQLEKMVMLRVIDAQWKDHLLAMDYLKEGIGLRGYGQKDPLVEYKREGFEMFAAMMERIKSDAVEHLFKIQVVKDQPPPAARPATPPPQRLQFSRGESAAQPKTVHRDVEKVGRNDPCPCGSGKKYKKCHGQ
ncbi:MAG: preprotein translocase subunit SecA [Nitrospirae bacterium]|nr:preprotein translocase subunit SecA [Nitrospirota bacterium]